MNREEVLAVAEQLPNPFEIGELIDRLIYLEKIQEGFFAAESGEFKTHEEVKVLLKSLYH